MEFIVSLINKDDNKSFQVEFQTSDLDSAWNKVAELCISLNSECECLELVETRIV